MVQESFGRFARRQRQAAGLGLRQAARLMGMSATYLSRVESDTDPPSAKLLHEMANAYKLPISDLAAQARARIGDRSAAAAHGLALESSAELRALYRMGTSLSAEEIQQFLRDYLREKKGFSENEIEYELAKLKSELPRIVKGRDDMFASQVRPRRLSKERIDKAAYSLLARYGLDEKTFSPPTPVELIVEQEPGIKYRIDKLACKKTGEPLVLGLTGWNDDGDREIIINGVLADSSNKTDGHRFNFTLAHELFHAIEHLPLTAPGRSCRVWLAYSFVTRPIARRLYRVCRGRRALSIDGLLSTQAPARLTMMKTGGNGRLTLLPLLCLCPDGG